VAEVATELGISEQTIYTWRRQARIDAGLGRHQLPFLAELTPWLADATPYDAYRTLIARLVRLSVKLDKHMRSFSPPLWAGTIVVTATLFKSAMPGHVKLPHERSVPIRGTSRRHFRFLGNNPKKRIGFAKYIFFFIRNL